MKSNIIIIHLNSNARYIIKNKRNFCDNLSQIIKITNEFDLTWFNNSYLYASLTLHLNIICMSLTSASI